MGVRLRERMQRYQFAGSQANPDPGAEPNLAATLNLTATLARTSALMLTLMLSIID